MTLGEIICLTLMYLLKISQHLLKKAQRVLLCTFIQSSKCMADELERFVHYSSVRFLSTFPDSPIRYIKECYYYYATTLIARAVHKGGARQGERHTTTARG